MNSITDERKGCGISFAEFQAQRLVSQILPSPVLPTGIKHDIEDGRREGLDYSDILLKIRVALRTSVRGSEERSLFLWLENELRAREAVGAKLKQDQNVTWITEHPAMTLAQWLDGLEMRTKKNSGARNNTNKDSLQVFREMKLDPTEIGIEFASGESGTVVLNITARGKLRRVALAEIGLFDTRKAEMNTLAVTLLQMTKKEMVTCAHKTKERLKSALTDHLGITRDPFEKKQGKGYRPLFSIKDVRNAADKRAKREAERKTCSYEDMVANGHAIASSDDYPFDDEDSASDQWLKENSDKCR